MATIADEYRPLDSLVPNPANYNRHGSPGVIGRMADKIRLNAFTAPFIIDESGLILGGHLRRLALLKLRADSYPEPVGVQAGWLVPCRLFEGTEIQKKALLVGDNPDPADLDYDPAGLASLLSELEQAGELAGAGYSPERLDALLAELALDPAPAGGGLLPDADPDAVPGQVEPRCRVGDLWELGNHRILCGDCRNPGDVARLLAGAKVNVVVTSPPYASQRKYDEESGFKPIPPEEYLEWFAPVQAGIREHLAEDGSYFLNIKEHCEDGQRHLYVKDLTLAHVREWGWQFVDEFCWKRKAVPGAWPNRFKNEWEPVFHFCQRTSIKFRPEAVGHESDEVWRYDASLPKTPAGFISGKRNAEGKSKHDVGTTGIARPGNLIEAQTGEVFFAEQHEATFPVALPEFFLKAFSDPGDSCLDPFLGSGTTLIAAEQTGRRAFGMELSAKYVDVCLLRWEQATGQTARLLERL